MRSFFEGLGFQGTNPRLVVQGDLIPNRLFVRKSDNAIIIKCVERHKEALQELQLIDSLIFYGTLIGIGCYVGDFIFPIVINIAIAAFVCAAYCAARREIYYQNYLKAFSNLKEVYDWVSKDPREFNYEEASQLALYYGQWVSLDAMRTAITILPQRLANGEHLKQLPFLLYGETGPSDWFNMLKIMIAHLPEFPKPPQYNAIQLGARI